MPINRKDVKHVGIDDWAVLKRLNYASTLVDLDTHKIIDMINSRSADDVTAWLKEYPNLKSVVRDGALFFRKAISRSHPDCVQISDRFHYISNITKHFREAIMLILPIHIEISGDSLARVAPELVVSPNAVSVAKAHKDQIISEAKYLHKTGHSNQAIATILKISRRTVAKYVSKEIVWKPRVPRNALLPYVKEVLKMHEAGNNNSKIFDKIKKEGYPRTYSTFKQYSRVLYEHPEIVSTQRITRKEIANLVYKRHGKCAYTPIIRYTFKRYPEVKEILSLLLDFVQISKGLIKCPLETWLEQVRNLHNQELDKGCFAIEADLPAIKNSIEYPELTNGTVEGKNNKTKYIKRTLFGRCSFVGLKNRILLQEAF